MIYERLGKVLAEGGNPRNNLLPRVPELRQVFDHPVIHGALQSILGPEYYLHLHRHVHDNHPGSEGQTLHKDSLYNSRYAVDEKRRHHRTRWAMVFYYPQDTPIDLGPTAVMPRSQYLNTQPPPGVEEVSLRGEAGTVTIVHYDLLHRGVADRGRPMSDAGVSELADRLGNETEIVGLEAAYELGTRGEAAVPTLIDALKHVPSAAEAAENDAVPRNAAYAFNRIGAPAVPVLLDAARNADPRVRARALDILGDMGLSATDAVPDLVAGLADEADDPRRRAAEALGTAGQASTEIAGELARRLREDPSGEVRRNSALSLARLGPNAAAAVPALARAMMDENHYVRGFSVYALTRIGTPEATEVLVRHLQTMRWDWA